VLAPDLAKENKCPVGMERRHLQVEPQQALLNPAEFVSVEAISVDADREPLPVL
jgi:hypothetical protein